VVERVVGWGKGAGWEMEEVEGWVVETGAMARVVGWGVQEGEVAGMGTAVWVAKAGEVVAR
jgi:hypothetical protein